MLLVLGWAAGLEASWLAVLSGAALLFIGVTACLAYMFIDLERYEVGRGYKAVHNPLKGQQLAVNLVHYGHRAGVSLLMTAAVAAVGGFAMLNQGLYQTIGRNWYGLADGAKNAPTYLDFLAYPLVHLLRIVDLMDFASAHHFLERDLRSPGAVAGLGAAGRVQGVLHPDPVATAVRLGAARQAALRDHCGVLESA